MCVGVCVQCVEADAKIALLGFTAASAAARTLTSTQFVHVDTFSARCQACKMCARAQCPCTPRLSVSVYVVRMHVRQQSLARCSVLLCFEQREMCGKN